MKDYLIGFHMGNFQFNLYWDKRISVFDCSLYWGNVYILDWSWFIVSKCTVDSSWYIFILEGAWLILTKDTVDSSWYIGSFTLIG